MTADALVAEMVLRMVDLERPEPSAATLDRLASQGHDRNGFCEKCWIESGRDAAAYLALLDASERVN